jgi:hypothetical protein
MWALLIFFWGALFIFFFFWLYSVAYGPIAVPLFLRALPVPLGHLGFPFIFFFIVDQLACWPVGKEKDLLQKNKTRKSFVALLRVGHRLKEGVGCPSSQRHFYVCSHSQEKGSLVSLFFHNKMSAHKYSGFSRLCLFCVVGEAHFSLLVLCATQPKTSANNTKRNQKKENAAPFGWLPSFGPANEKKTETNKYTKKGRDQKPTRDKSRGPIEKQATNGKQSDKQTDWPIDRPTATAKAGNHPHTKIHVGSATKRPWPRSRPTTSPRDGRHFVVVQRSTRL